MNINDHVYVTLTEAGRWHIAHRDDYYSPAEKAGQWQLWRLMHVFGEACYMGNDAMFEKNEVRFEPPA